MPCFWKREKPTPAQLGYRRVRAKKQRLEDEFWASEQGQILWDAVMNFDQHAQRRASAVSEPVNPKPNLSKSTPSE